ncbi:MAG: prenyltransferase/squalene oxidase repeat-containing protein [Isosphaeraceae bacterium]
MARTPFAALALAAMASCVAGPSAAQDPPVEGGRGTFIESRSGTVPEGAADQVTQAADTAIRKGLDWLAGQQNPDGSFGTGPYRSNVAVTSLAGLALMSSGSSPGRGPYGSQIDKAVQFVLDNTSSAGFINVPAASTHGPMYGHGFATLFLAEAYGMTRRPEIRDKLEKAVRLIIDTQNGEGGWRYQPRKADADLSVTICQINALRAAKNAGLFVPRETVEACIRYVKLSQNADGGFRPHAQPGAGAFPRSAAGVVALYSAGEYESKEIDAGIAYLKQFMPEINLSPRYSHFFYGHYYAGPGLWIRGAMTGTNGTRPSATS